MSSFKSRIFEEFGRGATAGLLLGTVALGGSGALALSAPNAALASTMVPFKATAYEHFSVTLCGTYRRCVTATAGGEATHLGHMTENSSIVVDINPSHIVNGCAPETRSTVLTAANGDEITMSATGWSCPSTNTSHDSYVVTGGTGRFEGASGSGVDDNVRTFTGPTEGTALTTYDGTLSSVGSL